MAEPAGEVRWGFTPAEAEYFRLMSEYKYEVDMQSARVSSERKGRAEGIAEGLAKGRWQEKEDMAKNALAKGYSVEQVCEITGLDAETIARLTT